ncbi:Hsp70 family protein [Corynebacterium crudilactis]|uniref:Molecular chaperone Hsp70 n=1 Tax=Corynebacterium crudilactis TaxID=1652495 RepID=A0A172QXE2_9CORY|nr:Hsp70 family protein [Corynebacterium crudilactis]ANE05383.1 molecular chaperone Hsp70 [Corynebacterium crudilactis]
MRFGLDLGTTRTIAAAVDRGNYPIVTVEDSLGDAHDFIPSVVALKADKIVAGWDAIEVGTDHSSFVRSFKRLLSEPNVTEATPVSLGEHTRPLGAVLAAFAENVVSALRSFQASLGDTSEIELVIGVPANAHSAQRLLTMSAFSSTGITVVGLVNEPSAAAFEYTHRHAKTLNSKRQAIVVYDLGGGTFDASLIRIDGTHHEVVSSIGISRLGGDDFDELLLQCALKVVGREHDAFGKRAKNTLLDECRNAKEALVPQSRRLVLEIGDDDVTVPVNDFYDAATPLVAKSLAIMDPLIGVGDLKDSDIAGIYLVGGASSLPLVSRLLRERFGRRVHRSPFPSGSTAVGLAIAADPSSGFHLRDRVARGIGVFREHNSGRAVSFDPLIAPDTDSATVVVRRYTAAHNIGWFRFVEYATVSADGSPGDISLLSEIKIPFDGSITDVENTPIEKFEGPEVEETITVNDNGVASIHIKVLGGVAIEHTI